MKITTQTQVHTLVDLNIQGTPKMPGHFSLEDLRAIEHQDPTVIGLQEMKWLDQWMNMGKVFSRRDWGRYPWRWGKRGSAQVILWNRDVWEPVRAKDMPRLGVDPKLTILLHEGLGRICQDRFINAVLLRDRETDLCCWFTDRHYVPGAFGPRVEQQAARQHLWKIGNKRDVDLITRLSQTGYPVFSVGDFNINDDEPFDKQVNGHRIEYIGRKGLDYVILVPGSKDDVDVRRDLHIPETKLRTDHAMRVVDFRLMKAAG